jgi:hypothetical protein
MQRVVLSAFAAALLCACGNSGSPLNTAMAGSWQGPIAIGGALDASFQEGQIIGELNYQGQIITIVNGNALTVTEICPDKTETVTANGSGNEATWSGNYACPAVPVTNCAAVTITYSNATATLNGSTLTVNATGTLTGCGTSGAITLAFSGTTT